MGVETWVEGRRCIEIRVTCYTDGFLRRNVLVFSFGLLGAGVLGGRGRGRDRTPDEEPGPVPVDDDPFPDRPVVGGPWDGDRRTSKRWSASGPVVTPADGGGRDG